jgi:hypothetical protein
MKEKTENSDETENCHGSRVVIAHDRHSPMNCACADAQPSRKRRLSATTIHLGDLVRELAWALRISKRAVTNAAGDRLSAHASVSGGTRRKSGGLKYALRAPP